eukprot:NODE_5_length_72347_cov_1.339331.p21 type:complete len:381 gc:universal NODE_5_length_72347_cov_1.339331:61975-63117(+)
MLRTATTHKTDVDYFKQFSNLYFCRLQQIKQDLLKVLRSKNLEPLEKVSDIADFENDKCIVIGIVFQDKKVQDYSKIGKLDYLNSFYLEDEYSRIPLDRNGQILLSGSVVAVEGLISTDKIVIQNIHYPYNFTEVPRNIVMEQKWICLLSGMEMGGENNTESLSLLHHLLSGQAMGIPLDILENLNAIVIIGDSFHCLSQKTIENMNAFVGNLSQYHNIVLVPSASDPTTVALPNSPIPLHLIPKALQTVSSVENPAIFQSEDGHVIFSSGDAINNITKVLKSSGMEMSSIDIARTLVKCKHLAPCCPDTLPCIPSYSVDPLYLKETPDYLFIGNMNDVKDAIVGKCRIILVPNFTATGKVVFYNFEQNIYKIVSISKDC